MATDADILVIGSGPGGAVTACLLAEAGREVMLLEEGSWSDPGDGHEFSRQEMMSGYRNAGITAMFGRPSVAYAEGCAVGGGSEINAGLYHRLPEQVRQRWATGLQLQAFDAAELDAHFAANERELPFIPSDADDQLLSCALRQGAERLGWHSQAPARLRAQDDAGQTRRSSMSRTFIARFRVAGGQLRSCCRVLRLKRLAGRWQAHACDAYGNRFTTCARHVFVACGAIQTPALLRASGLRRNIGRQLCAHVTVRAAGLFQDGTVPEGNAVCPVQAKPDVPGVSLGCSVSGSLFNQLFFIDRADTPAALHACAIGYAAAPVGSGQVHRLPLLADPVVRYQLSDDDLTILASGLKKLAEWLFAAGAHTVYPGARSLPAAHDPDALDRWPARLPRKGTPLQTVHLMASCPMGEDRTKCAVDSFGAAHETSGIHIADASLFGSAIGVNPQGTIMALARRNALHFLEAAT